MLASGWVCRLALLRHHCEVPGSAQLPLAAVLAAAAAASKQLLLRSYCSLAAPAGEASVVIQDGLPRFRLPLPSRAQTCQFTLKPLTNSVEDLARFIKTEDKGVETVSFYAKDGARIAGSNSVVSLLSGDFVVQLNDRRLTVSVSTAGDKASPTAIDEGARQLEAVKNSISQLYTGLSVGDFQLAREKQIVAKLDDLRTQFKPLEEIRLLLADRAARRTRMFTWLGLSYMGLQFGFLARLTWWEYSWDIMEPVIYFVGYGTVMVSYAYYVITKQEYTFPQVWDREYLKKFYSDAGRANFDVAKYNELRERITELETDLRRLRDPLLLGPGGGTQRA